MKIRSTKAQLTPTKVKKAAKKAAAPAKFTKNGKNKKLVGSTRRKTGPEPKKPNSDPLAIPLSQLPRLDFQINGMQKPTTDEWTKKVLIFTPSRGMVRMEWVQARYSQIIPTNWSFVEMMQFINPYVPIGYQLADAQNMMAKMVVEGDFEWVIYIEDDNVLPSDAFLRANAYMNEGTIPVVSGIYFLKSTYTEPLIYRGRGTSHFRDWQFGDRVWVDGIPFGFRLEHASLIKAAWEESEEYEVAGVKTRRVFSQPRAMWFDEEKGGMIAKGGTTDLEWCTRLMDDGIFAKAGWPAYQKMKNPFLVDTRIFVKHIDPNGTMWPLAVPARYVPKDPKYKGKDIK